MDPILKHYFTNFITSFELKNTGHTPDEKKKQESNHFEKFVNYLISSIDYPEMFTGNLDLLDYICVGGSNDTGIDGVGIRINDIIVDSKDAINRITETSKKINIDYIFIQTKMTQGFDIGEFSKFSLGVKNFFSDSYLPENKRLREVRALKDYIYSEQKIISKLKNAPNLLINYVTTGGDINSDKNFLGAKKLLEDDMRQSTMYFENIYINYIGGKQLIKFCKELENKYEVCLNIKDIFPLIVNLESEDDIKKAYNFTCDAREFLKILTKEDGQLRRSLFYSNVRDYLGNKGSVNSEIEETIVQNPELFLLCNNGITIVCSDFEQVRDKLVKIESPQIVNGCQTSNSIFNLRNSQNIDKVQLLVRIISTDNLDVSNKIVRGTNKQNQVLDEAFEATRLYHQDILEPYFLAIDSTDKLYYERRAKQYNNDDRIRKTQIINMRIIIQAFVSIALERPHESHIHEAKLLEQYGGNEGMRILFADNHDPAIYYICARIWNKFDKYFREGRINHKYKTYKAHLYFIVGKLAKNKPSLFSPSKALKKYIAEIEKLISPNNFPDTIQTAIKLFEIAQKRWQDQGKSYYGIKDNKGFTELLAEVINPKEKYIEKINKNNKSIFSGRIINIIRRSNNWFGFIERDSQFDNLYFDARGYNGNIDNLAINQIIYYEIGSNQQGEMAVNIKTENHKNIKEY